MIDIPEQYCIDKFYEYAYRVKRNAYNNTYQAECPICREGKSSGIKRRCYLIPKTQVIYCHNCGWSSKVFNWVARVSGLTSRQIIEDIKKFDGDTIDVYKIVGDQRTDVHIPDLPADCIDILSLDIDQFSHDLTSVTEKDVQIIKDCIKYVDDRLIRQSVNCPRALYVSLRDEIHRDRLIIPFYDENRKVIFYQSRKIFESDTKPKYVSKLFGEKSLCGLDKLTPDIDQVFIFEGPINSFFMKNGLALGGIQNSYNTFTSLQQDQVDKHLRFYQRIFVFDSQWIDDTSLDKTEKLIAMGEKVFIWPEKLGRHYKDFNEMCVKHKLNEVTCQFVVRNSFSGLEGQIRLGQLRGSRPRS